MEEGMEEGREGGEWEGEREGRSVDGTTHDWGQYALTEGNYSLN